MLVHACSPSYWEAEARELLEPERWTLQWAKIMPLYTSLGNMAKPVSTKNRKNWPGVVPHTCSPSTQEAEAEGMLELGKWRLEWAEIVPVHSSLGDWVKPCLKNNKKNRKTKIANNGHISEEIQRKDPSLPLPSVGGRNSWCAITLLCDVQF